MARHPEMKVFAKQMEAAGLDPLVSTSFERLYDRYRAGDPGKLPWAGVNPVGPGDVVPHEELQADSEWGEQLLPQLAVISSWSMGLRRVIRSGVP